MYKLARIVTLVAIIGLAGCAHTPPTVDLSDSIFKDETADKSANLPISWLSIVNYAPEEKGLNPLNPLSDKQFIIKRTPDPRVIVEEDLERYFAERLTILPDATRSIRVQINKVRIHVVETPQENLPSAIPIFGLLYVLAKAGTEQIREYVIQVMLSVEVKESDKIIAQHHPDILVSLKRKLGNMETENATYKELFAHYRQKLFIELDKQLIGRYFSKSIH